MYKLAREGKIKEFTGISDPYEVLGSEVILNSDGSQKPDYLLIHLRKTNSFRLYLITSICNLRS